jgi:hypothetical protein
MQAESLPSYRFEIPSPVLKESQPAAETIVPFLASTWILVMFAVFGLEISNAADLR